VNVPPLAALAVIDTERYRAVAGAPALDSVTWPIVSPFFKPRV